MRSVLDDRQTTRDYWFAVTLVYAGYELVSVVQMGKAFEFCILCPRFDFEECLNEWHAGKLQISDAKAYSQMATRVGHIIRNVKKVGEYTNPDYRDLLSEYEEDKKRGTLSSDESD